nr:hypothetical protein [Mammaliicoccus sp. Marseille-Q6498]
MKTKVYETQLYRNGNSQYLDLPKSIMGELELGIGEALNCYIENGRIIFEKKEKPFIEEWDEFFESGGSYKDYEKVDWGKTAGRELC